LYKADRIQDIKIYSEFKFQTVILGESQSHLE